MGIKCLVLIDMFNHVHEKQEKPTVHQLFLGCGAVHTLQQEEEEGAKSVTGDIKLTSIRSETRLFVQTRDVKKTTVSNILLINVYIGFFLMQVLVKNLRPRNTRFLFSGNSLIIWFSLTPVSHSFTVVRR